MTQTVRGGVAADEVIVHRRAPVSFDRFYADHFDRTHAVVLALRGPRSAAHGAVEEQHGGEDRGDEDVQRHVTTAHTPQR